MIDLNIKYAELNRSFPNKAGKLMEIMTTQKRLIESLAKKKQSEEVTQLLLKVAEGYDVAVDTLTYCKNVLQGVANDAEALQIGSKVRNIAGDYGELIEAVMKARHDIVETIRQKRLKMLENDVTGAN